MQKILAATIGRFSEETYAVLRIVAGFLFACHGAQKLLGWFGGGHPMPTAQLWTAGLIELVGGLMIAIGLGTRIAAFLASGLMAFAFFLAHFPRGILPIVNGGELAAVYSFLFLFIASKGPGIWAFDRKCCKHC